jgi:hypothetical protein
MYWRIFRVVVREEENVHLLCRRWLAVEIREGVVKLIWIVRQEERGEVVQTASVYLRKTTIDIGELAASCAYKILEGVYDMNPLDHDCDLFAFCHYACLPC